MAHSSYYTILLKRCNTPDSCRGSAFTYIKGKKNEMICVGASNQHLVDNLVNSCSLGTKTLVPYAILVETFQQKERGTKIIMLHMIVDAIRFRSPFQQQYLVHECEFKIQPIPCSVRKK